MSEPSFEPPNYLPVFISQIRTLFTILGKIPKQIPGRKAKLFNEFVDPTYAAMHHYHVDYIRMFTDASNKIEREAHQRAPSLDPSRYDNQQVIIDAVTSLIKARQKNDSIRQHMRGKLAGYLRSVEELDIRCFILACSDYFILDPDAVAGDVDFSMQMAGPTQIESYGDLRYDTPSSRTISRLRGLTNCGDAIEFLSICRRQLHEKFAEVMTYHSEVERAIKPIALWGQKPT